MDQQQASSSNVGIGFLFDKGIATLPEFLQPSDEQERSELAIFLSKVDELHKSNAGKLSASYVFNFLQRILKPPTPASEGPSKVTFPEHLQEYTENIALEIASGVINDVDIHNTIISVLNVLQDVSWEAKTTLMITTFALTFGDSGLNLCEESKVSINEIQLFAKCKDGFKQQLEGNKNLFAIVYKLIASILQFENLSAKYMKSKDPNVKIAQTQLIIVMYWIIKTIVAGAASHMLQLSSRRNEFDNTISALWELSCTWSKKLEELVDKDYLKEMLLRLQDLLKEEIDVGAYNKIKNIVEQGNHNDNLTVLNALIPSDIDGENLFPLYDCLRKRKVHLNELKGEYVLLFISDMENIAPEVEETKLNEFLNSYDTESENQIECNIVWMPMVEVEHSLHLTKPIEASIMCKPFIEWYYLVRYTNLLKDTNGEMNFKGWYSIGDPSKINNEVKKFIRDDWKFMKGEPIIVVLDPHGNVVRKNAIHMFYCFGVKAFPFTKKYEGDLYLKYLKYDALGGWYQVNHGFVCNDWIDNDDCIFLYGGETIEWIRSITEMVRGCEHELGKRIKMVYVGRNHNRELIQSVNEEGLSQCLSDQFYLWMFWKSAESIIYSMTHTGNLGYRQQRLQRLLNYDKPNVGWVVLLSDDPTSLYGPLHGKVVLSTLKEFPLWKEKASQIGFKEAFKTHFGVLDQKNPPPYCVDYPTSVLNDAPIDPNVTECIHCGNQMVANIPSTNKGIG